MSNNVLECRKNEADRNGVFLREGNVLHGGENAAAGALEYLAPRAGFSVRKFESMGDCKQGYPIFDGHRETILPTEKPLEP